jgi:hypothetical protein
MSKEQLSSCYIGKTYNLEWQQFLTGTANPSGAHEFTSGFLVGVRVT